jgi:hypothetical protein
MKQPPNYITKIYFENHSNVNIGYFLQFESYLNQNERFLIEEFNLGA